MTVESTQQFKVGDRVTFTEDADRHYCHAAGGTGVITDIEDLRGAGSLHYVVNAENATWWYTADELVKEIPQQATVKLDEHTVRNISEALSEIYVNTGITDGEIVVAVAAYMRGLQDGTGIDRNV